MSCLYILEIKPLMVSSFANIFFHSVGCLFVLIMVSFSLQKLVSLIRSHLFAFAFCCLGILNLGKHCYDLSENILPIISSSFMVSCLMFKSLSPFEFIFVHGVKECLNFIDSSGCPTFSTPFAKRLFPIVCSCHLCQRLIVHRCGFISGFSVPVSCFFADCSFVVLSEVWEGYTSCFFLRIALAILDLMVLYKF